MDSVENVERTPITEATAEVLAGIVNDEARQYSFNFKMHVNGVLREGNMTVKYPSVFDRMRRGTIVANFLNGAPLNSVDSVTYDIAFMMAYLQVSIVKAPKWWDMQAIDRLDELTAVFREVEKFHNTFRKQHESSEDAGRGDNATGTETVESM